MFYCIARVGSAHVVITLKENSIDGSILVEHLYGGSGIFKDPNRINPSDRLVLQSQVALNSGDTEWLSELEFEWLVGDSLLSRSFPSDAILTKAVSKGVGICDNDARSSHFFTLIPQFAPPPPPP